MEGREPDRRRPKRSLERRHPETQAAAPETRAARSAESPLQPASRLASRASRMDTSAWMEAARALAAGPARLAVLDLSPASVDGA